MIYIYTHTRQHAKAVKHDKGSNTSSGRLNQVVTNISGSSSQKSIGQMHHASSGQINQVVKYITARFTANAPSVSPRWSN